MTLSNAERQQRWRDKRNTLAREAIKLRQRLDGGTQHKVPLRNDPADGNLAAKDREIAALKKELAQAKARTAIKHEPISSQDDDDCYYPKKPSPELMKAFVKYNDWDFVSQIEKPIKEQFGNGKWHSLEKIAAAIDVPQWEVSFVLTLLSTKTDGCKCERRKSGTSYECRIFNSEKKISSLELKEKLTPIVKGVKDQGKRNMATMSPAQVAVLGGQLRKLLVEWTARDGKTTAKIGKG